MGTKLNKLENMGYNLRIHCAVNYIVDIECLYCGDTVTPRGHCLFYFLCQKLLDLAVRGIVFSVTLYFKKWKNNVHVHMICRSPFTKKRKVKHVSLA